MQERACVRFCVSRHLLHLVELVFLLNTLPLKLVASHCLEEGVREGLGVKQYFHLARSSHWLLLSCVRCLTDDSLTNKSQAEGVLSWPGVVARTCDPITWETEADGAPISG
ncbi:hypothetical protein ACRRTK_010314 [Alexandromys fortis]